MQRFKFNCRARAKEESIPAYVAALRQLSEFCEYGNTLQHMLRDRLVCGVNDEKMQRRLLSEPNLTYEKGLQLALAMEIAERNMRQLSSTRETPVMYHSHNNSAGRARESRFRNPSSPSTRACHRCGATDHLAPECRFIKAECRSCKKIGHLEWVCRSKPRGPKSSQRPNHPRSKPADRSHFVEEVLPHPEEEDDPAYSMFTLSDQSSSPYTLDVLMNGRSVTMEIDTGASTSIISEKKYNNLISAGLSLPLEETSVLLKTYSGEPLPVLGRILTNVKVGSKQSQLPLIVVKGEGPSLMGRDWLTSLKLNWQEIHQLESSNKLSSLLSSYSEVFDEGLGKLSGMKAKIHLKEGDAAKILQTQKCSVHHEKQARQGAGSVASPRHHLPVQFSEWAAPIVPVTKPDGSIRVCGDYKLTVNQASHTEQYPLPRVEDLFAALAGGKTFTKLDLSQAYLQLEMDESCKKFLTVNTHKGLFEYNRLPFGVSSAPANF